MIEYRPIEGADIPRIIELYAQYLNSGDYYADLIRASWEKGGYQGYAAVEDGEIAAFLTIRPGIEFTYPHPELEAELSDFVQGKAHAGRLVPVRDGTGVRGVVPQQIKLEKGAEHANIDLMFRPDRVYQNPYVVVKADGKPIFAQKKMIMAPGEMANITLKQKELAACEDAEVIEVSIAMEKPAL